MKHFGWLLILSSTCCDEVFSQVKLSEIMFDAAGSEAHDEFVEIYNSSETDSVDLAAWQLSDGPGFDTIVESNQGLILKPRQFGIILDGSYPGNSTTYDARLPQDCLILTIDNLTFGNAGFSNSTPETIALINSDGLVVSEYTYSLDNEMGFSDEKIDLAGSDLPENWANSRLLLGTPGMRNSVSPLNYDLGILSDDLLFSPPNLRAGETATIVGLINNFGLLPAQNFSAILFEDLNDNSLPETPEQIGSFDFPHPLASRDSATFEFRYENLVAGRHSFFIEVRFNEDEDTTNNLAEKKLLVGYPERTLAINEIMYSPLSNRAEWTEVFNPGSEAVDLNGWRISDSDTVAANVISAEILVPPAGYFVFAQDSSLLSIFNPPPGSFLILKPWPSLNNDFDSIVLFDLVGSQIDRVDYSSDWGGDTGISLEKVNPQLSANDSSSWSSCVAALGGTPGGQNSIFSDVLVSETTIAITPNPFSPDGDGRDDFAIISLQLPLTTAVINVKIYDVRGRLIRFLANNESSGSHKIIVWDGKDDNGLAARLGIYVVYLQALNAQAGQIKSGKQTLVLANKL
ncbi:MAG TPA: lamin tail domain-containing protein [bacterium]